MLQKINKIFLDKDEEDKEIVEKISKEFMSQRMACPVDQAKDKEWRNIFAPF